MISISIPTYDRVEYLKKMSASLYSSYGLDKCKIRVYDDCGKISMTELRYFFPNAIEIIKRKRNLGSCQNIHQAMINFLNTGEEVLALFDSDLIFNPHWINFTIETLPYTDGIFSLYNSSNHPSILEVVINNQLFLLKHDIGSAGVIMKRDIVKRIINNVPFQVGYDWAWSEYLCNEGIRILTPVESYVQHIGVHGHNNHGEDYGMNFVPHTELNIKILEEFNKEIGW